MDLASDGRSGDGDVSVVSTQDNMGIVYENLGQYEEALKMHNLALETRIQCLGTSHATVAAGVQDRVADGRD